MILGMSTATFTLLHVIISLLGIASGLVVLVGMLSGRPLNRWNGFFLLTTIATSVTGFMFHSKSFGPPHVVGVISLVVLAVALFALYSRHLSGSWRRIYAACAVLALYLNVFVGVVQAFQKIPFLHALAPNGSEPPFAIAQGVVLIIFVALGIAAAKRFRPTAQTIA
jgi:hypothetical protein